MAQEPLDALKQERDRFVAFAFASADILLELNGKSEVVFAGGATQGLLGVSADELEGKRLSSLVVAEQADIADNMIEGLSKVQRVEKVELTFIGRSESELPMHVSGFRLGHMQDHMYLSAGVVRSEGEANGEIFRRDMYSGLLKKESYVEEANKRIQEAKGNGEEVKVTLLDFPQLKDLLDSLPADVAAQLMGEISEYMRENSLDGDSAAVVGDGAYSFMHDGSVSETEIATKIMDISKKLDPAGKGIEAKATTLDTDPKHLTSYDSANALLYTINKFADENREDFCIDSLADSYENMLEDTVERIAAFKETIDTSQFDIAYQPIVDLHNGIIHHHEALVRLHNSDTFSNPFQFICFGEQAGVIGDFDLAMTQRTINALQDMKKQRKFPKVAVNLSGKSLSSSLFMDAFERLIDKEPALRKQLIIEVTESSKIQDIVSANNFIQRLRDGGNKCCLDDFGAGESSFDYLRNIQVDFVKIDGSYVKESLVTRRGREMLRAMSALCRDLGMATIGEFVEDHKTAALLWECGVRFGQGYLFAKPDTNIEVLASCGMQAEGYSGIVRAKRFDNTDKAWWSNRGKK